MWQWTSVGRLDGYSGNLDCDEFYGDTNTWNKYAGKVVGTAAVAPSTAPQVVEAKPTADQIAQYIVAGTNGWNGVYGEERYTKLATLGYNAAEVQQKVNALMGHTTVNTAKYVTVQAGNTLSGIAAANGTTWQKLQSINGISNPNRIYVGQRIRVK
jgi:LysM repeat protein